MNNDRLQGEWKQVKGKVKEKWGKLTDDDLKVIDGQTDQLIGRIQERYGIAREEAQKQFEQFQTDYQRSMEHSAHRQAEAGKR